MRWVKVSDRLPEKPHNYFVKATTKYQGYNHNDTALYKKDGTWEFLGPDNGRFVVEWLDESQDIWDTIVAERDDSVNAIIVNK